MEDRRSSGRARLFPHHSAQPQGITVLYRFVRFLCLSRGPGVFELVGSPRSLFTGTRYCTGRNSYCSRLR